jgi:hypothetical protein
MDMPCDRALGPDSYSDLFFKLFWDIIADDIAAALDHLQKGHFRSFRRLNSSILTLLPKKGESFRHHKEFRPISLIHGFSKIFTKILAARLAPLLPSLVSQAHSALSRAKAYMKTSN